MKINPQKTGLVGAIMVGGVHVLWSILVALGWAQALVNFSLWAHMVHLNPVIGPFDLTASVTLVIVAALIGYCVGYMIGEVWNRVHRLA